MAQITIQSSAQFQSVIDQLTSMRTEFVNKSNALDAEHMNVTTKWQGDASDVMREHWLKKRQNFQSMAEVLNQYIQALGNILVNYETAEEKNKQVAGD